MRLFVSVDLPEDLADAVAEAQDPLRPADGIRTTDPEQAHVTLKFLGDVPATSDDPEEPDLETTTAAVESGVADADVAPFDVAVGGIGAFPSHDYISVVWLGVEAGAEELTALQAAIEDRTVAAGFDPEDHEFTPHVTIARMDHAGGKERVQRVLEEREPSVGSFRATQVRLTKSELGPDGPAYSTVEAFEL